MAKPVWNRFPLLDNRDVAWSVGVALVSSIASSLIASPASLEAIPVLATWTRKSL